MDWLKKLLAGKFGKPAIAPVGESHQPTEQELLDEFRGYVRRHIASGYGTADDALDSAIDIMSDDLDPAMLRQIGPATLNEEIAAQLEREAGFPATTDCDRLDEAFASLEETGILARQNYTCCGTCGAAEIWDEMNEVTDDGRPVRGYLFFHWQDTDAAVDGSGLYLNYGALAEGDEAAVAIGKEAQRALEQHGLQTHWSGEIGQRIGVSLEWQRRMPRPASGSLH